MRGTNLKHLFEQPRSRQPAEVPGVCEWQRALRHHITAGRGHLVRWRAGVGRARVLVAIRHVDHRRGRAQTTLSAVAQRRLATRCQAESEEIPNACPILRSHGPHRDHLDVVPAAVRLQQRNERCILVARAEAVRQHQELLPFRIEGAIDDRLELWIVVELVQHPAPGRVASGALFTHADLPRYAARREPAWQADTAGPHADRRCGNPSSAQREPLLSKDF